MWARSIFQLLKLDLRPNHPLCGNAEHGGLIKKEKKRKFMVKLKAFPNNVERPKDWDVPLPLKEVLPSALAQTYLTPPTGLSELQQKTVNYIYIFYSPKTGSKI